MKELIDTIFNPVLGWLQHAISYLSSVSVPAAKPIRLEDYLGYFVLLGPYWTMFISQVIAMAVIYCFLFLIVSSDGLYIRFKDSVKWW